MRIDLEFDGYDQNDGELKRLFQKIAGRSTQAATRGTMNQAKSNAPVDHGTLRNSHRQDPVSVRGWHVDSAVVATAKHALFVHEGTSPHVILPRTKKMLSWKGAGGRVFATRVNHPGTTARPWLLNAARTAAPPHGFTVSGS